MEVGMMSEQGGIDWATIGAALAAPFAPDLVDWRVQGKTGAGKRVQLVPYVSARDVMERLDSAVGPGGWSFELEPLAVVDGELRVARGRLTIYGVSRDDIGTASNFEASKGCASDALKRAAVSFGVGRYLYNLPPVWVTLDGNGQIPEATLVRLREGLARRAA